MKKLFTSLCLLCCLSCLEVLGQGAPPFLRNPLDTNAAVSVPLNLEVPQWNGTAWDFVTMSDGSGSPTTNLIVSLSSTNGYFIYTSTADGNSNAFFVLTNLPLSLVNTNGGQTGYIATWGDPGATWTAPTAANGPFTNLIVRSSGAASTALQVLPQTGSSSNVVARLAGTNGTSGLRVTDAGNVTNSGNLHITGSTTAIGGLNNGGNNAFGILAGGYVQPSPKLLVGSQAAPTALIEAQGTTEQFRIRYDSTHYLAFIMNSAGDLALIQTGGSVVSSSGLFAATNGFATYRSNGLPLTAITFPASGVNWTNNAANTASPVCNIDLHINNNGITGTAIIKNGTTLSTILLTSDYILPMKPGDYFSETYTLGTPTGFWEPQ